MKTKLLAMMLLAGGSIFAQSRFSVGISIGGHGGGFYQPRPVYQSYIPPCPGPDYTWVDGYWSQNYGRNIWVAGYWNRQPFRSVYQVAPRFDDRFNERDDRRGFIRGSEHDQNRWSEQDRSFRGQDRDRNDQGNGYTNGFRGR